MIHIQSRHERSYHVQGNDSSTRKRHHKSLIKIVLCLLKIVTCNTLQKVEGKGVVDMGKREGRLSETALITYS